MANTARLQYPNKKQFIVTLPQALVRAKGWKKGEIIEFVIDECGNIVLRRLEGRDHA